MVGARGSGSARNWLGVGSGLALCLCGSLVLLPGAGEVVGLLGPLAPVALVLVQAATVVVVPVPAWPGIALAVLLCGPWAGFGIGFAGAVLGSAAAHLLAGRFGAAPVRRHRGEMHGGRDGLWLVPLLALPVPFGGDLGCYSAGLVGVPLRRFLVLVCVGRVPGTALAVLTASGAATGSATALVVASAVLMLLALLARSRRAGRQPATSARSVRARAEPRAEQPRAELPLPSPVAFCFGAGGSHGAVQVGQLRALHEQGVRPDFVIGCSVGALNAAVVAADPDRAADELDRVWRGVRARDLFRPDSATPRQAVFGNDGLRSVLESVVVPSFGDARVPLHVVAVERRTGRKRVLQEGPLVPALLAGCAIPVLLPPVTIDGVELTDGGMRHDLPIAEAFALGAASVVALPTTRWPSPVGYRSSGPVDDERVLLLDGAVAPGTGWCFARTSRLIERGYRAGSGQLAALAGGAPRPPAGERGPVLDSARHP